MTEPLDLAAALARAARDLDAPHDLPSTLDAIVQTATHSLDGIDHAGVSIVHRDGRVETRAGTGQLVWELDHLQYDLGEGPCLDAIREHPVVLVNDIRHDPRWPRFVPRAVALGVRAQLGVRLYVDDKTLGGLNLYSTQTETIEDEVEHLAELFAAHAALALGRARQEEHLHTALTTRKVIGQAVGIVMERFDLDEDRAFRYLMRVSQHSNIKLRDIAQELVDQRRERDPG